MEDQWPQEETCRTLSKVVLTKMIFRLFSGKVAMVQGLAFCGDSLKVASVLLEDTVDTPKEAEEIIAKLKSAHIPEQNAVGFMFACVGRGSDFYGKHNVEADAFHKLFPTVPLFGLFGNGEIGYEYLPDYSKPEGDSNINLVRKYAWSENPDNPIVNEDGEIEPHVRRSDDDSEPEVPKMHHSYCTVLVLLSLGSQDD